jgi:hypothetical protein
MALKRAIEPLERREARQRQGCRADLCLPATVAELSGVRPTRIASRGDGSRTTVDRAEAVKSAGRGGESEKWRAPTVDRIGADRSLQKPQNAPNHHRCASRPGSKHCK